MPAALESPAAKSKAAWLIATFFGVGHLRPGPGTWASAITVLCWWGISHLVAGQLLIPVSIVAAILITVLGIPPSTIVARESGQTDPGFVVIDEVAGQMISLIGTPIAWKYLLASFILFRGFDIIKPFPLRRLERLSGGLGIMMDDVGAGIYALVLLQVWLHLTAR